MPDKISYEYNLLQSDPTIDCIYSNFHRIALDGTLLSTRFTTTQPSGTIFSSIAKGTFGILRTMLARYESLKKVGYLNTNTPKYDGYLLTLLLSQFCNFAYVDMPLVLKKEYPQSDSKQLEKSDHYNDLVYIWREIAPSVQYFSRKDRVGIVKFWDKTISRCNPNNSIHHTTHRMFKDKQTQH